MNELPGYKPGSFVLWFCVLQEEIPEWVCHIYSSPVVSTGINMTYTAYHHENVLVICTDQALIERESGEVWIGFHCVRHIQ